jgi:PAS domain S-box-containing protein
MALSRLKNMALQLLVLMMMVVGVLTGESRADYRQNLLILNSYDPGYKWTEDIISGITAAVQESRKSVTWHTEFMDTKRVSDDEYFRLLYETYRYKFRNSHFDAIITSDTDAFNFMLRYRDRLFPGTPVVFCGVNDFTPADLHGAKHFTGVNEKADFKGTIDLALRLHPDTRQVVVINDMTTTGEAVHRQIAQLIPQYRQRVSFTFLEDYEMPQLLAKVHTLGPGSLVLYTFFFRDKTGRFFKFDQGISMISRASRVPVYGTWDFNLGYGIVGGLLTCGYAQGKAAGTMAMRILQGESADRIPVLMQSTNRYMFDYRQLHRFGISESSLPRGSKIINRPLNLYQVHRSIIWGIASALAGLLLIILLLLRNIAMKKQAQQELARSEERYRSLTIATSQIVWITDSSGRARGDLASWREYTGQSQDEIRGYGFCDAIHPEERQRAEEEWQAAVQARSVYDSEYRLRRRDGAYRYFAVRGVPVLDKNGMIREWVGTCTDITEKRRAEQALRESEELFRSAFNQSAVGIVYTTPEGNWLRINQRFCEITGYCDEELEALTFEEITHPEDKEITRNRLQALLHGEVSSYCLEKRYLRKDGSTVWVNVNVSMIDNEKGEHLFCVVVAEDITARKKVEEELRRLTEELEQRVQERTGALEQSQQELELQNRVLQETFRGLEEETEERIRVIEELRLKDQLLIHQSRMAAMGEMLGNIAHQWRQPLNVLGLKVQELGLSYKLGRFSKELLDENIAKVMEILVHMSRTIDDFRTFSTPDKHKVRFRVDEVIAKTVSLIGESFKYQGITLETEIENDPQIDGHPNEYAQVLLNILMNARDAIVERQIREPRIQVRARSIGSRTEVSISDNAGGIDEAILDRIFDPYFTTKELGKGTGVGLFMSKAIIEKNMGGTLTARNVEGGAEFTIVV